MDQTKYMWQLIQHKDYHQMTNDELMFVIRNSRYQSCIREAWKELDKREEESQ